MKNSKTDMNDVEKIKTKKRKRDDGLDVDDTNRSESSHLDNCDIWLIKKPQRVSGEVFLNYLLIIVASLTKLLFFFMSSLLILDYMRSIIEMQS